MINRTLALFATVVLATAMNLSPAAGAGQTAADDAAAETRGSGPYPAIMEADASLPDHVIYRPADLSSAPKLGVLVWGNGACTDDGASARKHLGEIASHGYLVIAAGNILSGPAAAAGATPAFRGPGPDGILPSPATTTEDLREGIDWAVAENSREGSPYAGRIDTQAIAASGHSCGGLQAIQLARDTRVKTVLVHNSGIYNDGKLHIRDMHVSKEDLAAYHQPVIYILGGPTDIAYANGTDDFTRIKHVPAAAANLEVGHGGTFQEPFGGAVASVAVDWLEWRLRGNNAAGRTFDGPACRLCVGSAWKFDRNW
jgi:hypothetical protein